MYAVRTMGDLASDAAAEASLPPPHAPAATVDAGTLAAVGLGGVALGAFVFFVLQKKKRRR